MAREKFCGAYVLTHVQSGHLYIGSTKDLHGRKVSHVIALRNGVHRNKRLQALYDVDPALHFSGIPFLTKEEALDEEQRMIDMYKGSPFLLNRAMNARNPGEFTPESRKKIAEVKAEWGYSHSAETKAKIGKGRAGKLASDETKQKMRQSSAAAVPISIDGTLYASYTEAARSLCIKYGKVRWRVSSDTYPTWFEVKEN